MLLFPEIYHDFALIVVLHKSGHIIDDNLTMMHPLTGIEHKVNVYSDKGRDIVNSMFRSNSDLARGTPRPPHPSDLARRMI